MVIRKMEVYVLDIIMEVALACVISAGGIGGIIIAVVKLSVASIEKRFERKYTEKFAVFKSDIDKKQYISQVRFDAEFVPPHFHGSLSNMDNIIYCSFILSADFFL